MDGVNRRAVRWAVGCALLGALMLGLGIDDVVSFRPSSGDVNQSFTFDQVVDLFVASLLLIAAALLVIGQLKAARQRNRHRRWVAEHLPPGTRPPTGRPPTGRG